MVSLSCDSRSRILSNAAHGSSSISGSGIQLHEFSPQKNAFKSSNVWNSTVGRLSMVVDNSVSGGPTSLCAVVVVEGEVAGTSMEIIGCSKSNVSTSGISIVGGKGGSYRARGLLLLLLLAVIPSAGASPTTQVLLLFGSPRAASSILFILRRILSMIFS